MKNLLILCVLLMAGYFGYNKFVASTSVSDVSRYSLDKVEGQPIPKNVIFKLWKERALQSCAKAKEDHNLAPEQCRDKISERHSACERSASIDAPELIKDRVTSKRLAHQYLECVTPHYFCNGTEVRTEEEAQKFCK